MGEREKGKVTIEGVGEDMQYEAGGRARLPHDRRRPRRGLQLAEGGGAREVLHAAVGGGEELVGRQVLQAGTDAVGDLLRRLDLGIVEVDHAQHHLLGREVLQHAEVELGLRRFDRDLLGNAVGELRQEANSPSACRR